MPQAEQATMAERVPAPRFATAAPQSLLHATARKVPGSRPLGYDGCNVQEKLCGAPLGAQRYGRGHGQLPLLTMIGVRHSIVCGRVSLRKVAVEWVTWFTIFFQRAPSEEELITHAWPAPTIRRLGVLDRKLRGAKFSANYTASGG